ncbi:hypothetical protein [Sinorhizobium terangae]|uniref:Antifreeze protein n=1 Tax=Sinorhizobium terangae TaxID=110322 RepID=A0A6N7LQL6_SINTE|nr:hypothetical protein [Sinorhizobium terangae]MBB4189552.1 hypothetical protein [Sinorhizobium terangae]MQX19340.1 hypothetical protein [Sinorhizobium terangae]WFU48984.1 hypothetical protein QA637_06145 [Sinorhizobium terangae]
MNIGKVLATGLTVAGALMALPSASPAQSLDLYLGPGGPDVRMRDRDYDRDYRRGCSERQAIRRAYSLGLDDPEIESVTRRQVVVDGVGRRGRYTTVYFANRPGCPRIG